jgi:SAM-dependent methyltransferase
MKADEFDRDSLRLLVNEAVLGSDLCRATFGGGAHRGTSSSWVRVVVRPVAIREERCLQFTYFDGRKTITKNYNRSEAGAPLDELHGIGFSGIHLSTLTEEIDIRLTKKGKVLIGRHAAEGSPPDPVLLHNRVKEVPLPEGQANPLLEAMGILTRAGRVRPTMRPKFTQINEFLKHLRHVLGDTDISSLGREVTILDCGCGASYLTLAVHHYLNEVLGIPARLLGVDLNEEVIRKSIARVEHFGARGVELHCGPIASVEVKADIVLALHACDTATDDALVRAIHGEARLILCVPCCHRDLNRELRPRGQVEALRALLRHGILRERLADLLTDAFRAQALRIMGYKTDVVEFVSPEHTARNLMIRAIRGFPVGEASAVHDYLEMRDFCGITPCIERQLGEPFQRLLAAGS